MANYQLNYPSHPYKPHLQESIGYMPFSFMPTEITDGDTIKGNFDKGHGQWVLDVNLRIRGIDCAEVKSSNPQLKRLGLLAREFVERIIPIRKMIIVHSFYAKKFSIEDHAYENNSLQTSLLNDDFQQLLEREKFGRYPIDIPLKPATLTGNRVWPSFDYLSNLLIQNHLAVPYPKPINRKLLIPQHIENYKKVFND